MWKNKQTHKQTDGLINAIGVGVCVSAIKFHRTDWTLMMLYIRMSRLRRRHICESTLRHYALKHCIICDWIVQCRQSLLRAIKASLQCWDFSLAIQSLKHLS